MIRLSIPSNKSIAICLSTLLFCISASIAKAGPAEDDYAQRCAQPGVVRCVGFDDPAEITKFLWKGAGKDNITHDTSINASGGGAARFEIPPLSGEGSGSGALAINFSDSPFPIQFGENEEFYVQWRQMVDTFFLEHHYDVTSGPGGWKQVIIAQGDTTEVTAGACSENQIVVVNTNYWKIPQAYHGCFVYAPYHKKDPDLGWLLQNETKCQWNGGNPNPDDGKCVRYFANEFMTFQVHVKLGPYVEGVLDPLNNNLPTNGFYPSTFEMWVARDGELSVMTHRFDNVIMRRNNYPNDPKWYADPNAKFGKLWLTSFISFKDSAENHQSAFTWFDEIVISRSKIADPGFPSTGNSTPPPQKPATPTVTK